MVGYAPIGIEAFELSALISSCIQYGTLVMIERSIQRVQQQQQ